MKTTLILAFCMMSVLCQFNPTRTITIPTGTIDIQYSPDQQFLGAASTSNMYIFKAHTGQKIADLTFDPLNYVVQTFGFSRDGNFLAIGFRSGEVRAYGYAQNTFKDLNKTYKYPGSSSIDSLCFNADDSGIIIGVKQDTIVYWPRNDGPVITTNFGGNFVSTVSCSPTDPLLFVVGGYLGTSTNQFNFYTYNDTNITLVKQINADINSKIQGSDISADGLFAYRVGQNGFIYRYNITGDFAEQNLQLPELLGKNLTKVRVSYNGRLIATTFTGKVAIVKQEVTEHVQFKQLQAIVVELHDTTSPTVALSPKGSHVIFASLDGTAAVYDECKKGQYADDLGGCLNCSPNCIECENAATCYACDARYYLNGGVCAKCSPGCLQCVDDTQCTLCDIPGHFVPTPNNTCDCDHAFFFRDQYCFACSIGCMTCTSQTQCTDCKPEFELIDKVCICPAATYPVDQTCLACERGCAQCKDDVTCEKCKVAQHFILNETSCICDPSGHYEDDVTKTICVCSAGYYDLAGKCMACPLGCKTCTSPSICQTCQEGLQTKGGLCECIQAETFINPDGKCVKCKDTLDFCIECTNQATCTQCDSTTFRQPKNGICVCRTGYFEDADKQCQLCTIKGCLECKDGAQCNVCDSGQFWEKDPDTLQCKCMSRYVEVENLCVKCPVGCHTCDVNGDCLQCDAINHWEKDGTGCKCMRAYYEEQQKCLPCMPGCLNCTDNTICYECDQISHFDIIDGVCICKYGFYPIDTTCLHCNVIPNCLNCVDASHCTQCPAPFHVNQTQQCGCEAGKFAKQNLCQDCPEGCKQCDHQDICTECQDKYDLEDNQCKKSGIDTLVIVLIVVGVIVLAGAIFVIIKCIKKRRTPLSQDDYEEL